MLNSKHVLCLRWVPKSNQSFYDFYGGWWLQQVVTHFAFEQQDLGIVNASSFFFAYSLNNCWRLAINAITRASVSTRCILHSIRSGHPLDTRRCSFHEGQGRRHREMAYFGVQLGWLSWVKPCKAPIINSYHAISNHIWNCAPNPSGFAPWRRRAHRSQ